MSNSYYYGSKEESPINYQKVKKQHTMKMLYQRANTMLHKEETAQPELAKMDTLVMGDKVPLLNGGLSQKWRRTRKKLMAFRAICKLREEVLMFGTSTNLLDAKYRGT